MFAKGWWTGWVREKTNRSKQNEGYTNHKRRDDAMIQHYCLIGWSVEYIYSEHYQSDKQQYGSCLRRDHFDERFEANAKGA